MAEPNTKLFAFYIPREWSEALEAAANRELVSMSDIGRRALARELGIGAFAAPLDNTAVLRDAAAQRQSEEPCATP